jgi:ribonuclease HI
MITIFTDGSSRGNPGPGGWGAIVINGDHIKELGGSEKNTTNNRMEIKAAIEALRIFDKNSSENAVTIYTDSSYLINGITKWVKGWKEKNWLTIKKEAVLNKDLWMELDSLLKNRNIKWEYVGGHVGVSGNERCDVIATSFADGKKFELFHGDQSSYPIKNILNIDRQELKVSTKSRRDAQAYSYISMVNRKIEIHHSWAECEKRVKGVKGAKYRKSLNAEDEEKIVQEFRTY